MTACLLAQGGLMANMWLYSHSVQCGQYGDSFMEDLEDAMKDQNGEKPNTILTKEVLYISLHEVEDVRTNSIIL